MTRGVEPAHPFLLALGHTNRTRTGKLQLEIRESEKATAKLQK